MKFITEWWGIKENMPPLEMMARSAAMFVAALILIRVSGMRPFGKGDAFDRIITFLIGAILSRGIVGATPFFSCIFSMIIILLIHHMVSKLTMYSKSFGYLAKGRSVLLYREGEFIKTNMQATNITVHDMMEEIRCQLHKDSFDAVKEIYMERTGKLSFVVKDA